MKTYSIANKISGADLGNFEGMSEIIALDAMAVAAGYNSYEDCCAQVGEDDLVVAEVE